MRIDYCGPLCERTHREILENRNANIFRMMAHSPSYFKILPARQGDPRQGELDPVVQSSRSRARGSCEAPYEVAAHKRSKEVGVTDDKTPLEKWKSATCFDDLQRGARLHR